MMSVLIICVIASILCERRMANLEGLYESNIRINLLRYESYRMMATAKVILYGKSSSTDSLPTFKSER